MRYLPFVLLAALPLFGQDFYRFTVDQDRLGGAPDFSFLNHPLAPADRLFVRDGHFYRVGADLKPNTADDERVRLFGANFAFGANFPEEADAVRIAKRLRRLGFNLVRLHHMDSSPDRDPQTARSLLTTGPYPTLNPVSVARLRRFLDALKAEGIYANLNLHVGYQFRPSVDHVPAVPGMDFPTQSKPLHIFFPRMVELQTEYVHKVMTALKLKGDPVLGMAEIDNETSLVEAWQRGKLQQYAVGEYKTELDRQFQEFQKSGGSDYLLFLVDRDRSYLGRMLAAIRESADNLVPVAGTQMGFGGLLNLDSHQDLSYQDNHFYIDHYNFPHKKWDARDWRIRDASSVGTGMSTILNVAATRESGRPFTVSEFNQPWPNRQAAEIDPTLAVFAAFQDWDALEHFAYEHGRAWENTVPSGFNLNTDWTKYAGVGQAAWLFRSGAIQPGKSPVGIPVPQDLRLRSAREKRVGNVAPFLAAAIGYDPAIAFVHPVGLTMQDGPAPAAAKAPYQSDTGEILYDPGKKIFLVHAPEAAGAFGFLGKQKVSAGALDVELGASARGFAAILVTALDGKPLANSTHLLITTPGYTLATARSEVQKFVAYPEGKDWWTLESDVEGKPSGNRDGGKPPVWMERVESTLTLRTSAARLEVYPLDGAGARLKPLNVQRLNGAFRIHLQAEGQDFAPWYEVVAR